MRLLWLIGCEYVARLRQHDYFRPRNPRRQHGRILWRYELVRFALNHKGWDVKLAQSVGGTPGINCLYLR